jgi:hypothetical protein
MLFHAQIRVVGGELDELKKTDTAQRNDQQTRSKSIQADRRWLA